jgi:ribosome maturation factor RimP
MLSEQLETLLKPVIIDAGLELYGLQILRSQPTVLRIFIDSETGINAEQCATVSRRVGSILEVENVFSGAYRLEVSSPGIDRPLFTKAHFQDSVGSRVKIRLSQPQAGQRNGVGLLSQVNEETVHLVLDDGRDWIVDFNDILKASLRC